MSKPIKAGDLVLIVKPMRCGCNGFLGKIFRVRSVAISPVQGQHFVSDGGCGTNTYPAGTAVAYWPDTSMTTELRRLKRIPPLGELEGEKRKEELTA